MQNRIDVYENAQDMMICELDKIVQKNELTPNALDYVDKLVDIIKDLDEILNNEEMHMTDDYEQRGNSRGYYNMRGNSYRGNMRMNYTRNNSRNNGMMSNEVSPMNNINGNSSGSGKKEMLDHLYMAMDNSPNEDERKRIQRMINEIEGK